MLKIILLSLVFFFTSVQAQEFDGWKIVKVEGDQFSLQKKGMRFLLEEGNVKQTLKKVKRFKNLLIIIFHQSTNGTSFMVDTYDAVVFDWKKEKFLGEFTYKHIPVTEHTQEMLSPWPKWIYNKNHLRIIDEDSDVDKIIYVN